MPAGWAARRDRGSPRDRHQDHHRDRQDHHRHQGLRPSNGRDRRQDRRDDRRHRHQVGRDRHQRRRRDHPDGHQGLHPARERVLGHPCRAGAGSACPTATAGDRHPEGAGSACRWATADGRHPEAAASPCHYQVRPAGGGGPGHRRGGHHRHAGRRLGGRYRRVGHLGHPTLRPGAGHDPHGHDLRRGGGGAHLWNEREVGAHPNVNRAGGRSHRDRKDHPGAVNRPGAEIQDRRLAEWVRPNREPGAGAEQAAAPDRGPDHGRDRWVPDPAVEAAVSTGGAHPAPARPNGLRAPRVPGCRWVRRLLRAGSAADQPAPVAQLRWRRPAEPWVSPGPQVPPPWGRVLVPARARTLRTGPLRRTCRSCRCRPWTARRRRRRHRTTWPGPSWPVPRATCYVACLAGRPFVGPGQPGPRRRSTSGSSPRCRAARKGRASPCWRARALELARRRGC